MTTKSTTAVIYQVPDKGFHMYDGVLIINTMIPSNKLIVIRTKYAY